MDCNGTNNPFGATAPNDNGTNDFCIHNTGNNELNCAAARVCGASDTLNEAYLVRLSSADGWAAMVVCDSAASTAVDYCAVFDDTLLEIERTVLSGTDNMDYLSFEWTTFTNRALSGGPTLIGELNGADGDDVLIGAANYSGYTENHYGKGGADHVFAHAGADFIYGGDDADFIVAGDGADQSHGEAGDDFIAAGPSGTTGTDATYGEGGNDLLCGKDASIATTGFLAGLELTFSSGSRPIAATAMDWNLWTGTSVPTCTTGSGRPDFIDAGAGDDRVYAGGASQDENQVSGGSGTDELRGGGDGDDLCDPGNEGDALYSGGGTPSKNRLRTTKSNANAYLEGPGTCSDYPGNTIVNCTAVSDYTCPF